MLVIAYVSQYFEFIWLTKGQFFSLIHLLLAFCDLIEEELVSFQNELNWIEKFLVAAYTFLALNK